MLEFSSYLSVTDFLFNYIVACEPTLYVSYSFKIIFVKAFFFPFKVGLNRHELNHTFYNLCDYMKVFRRRQWHPTPVLLPGKSHGWRSLVGCSPWGR